MESEGRHVEWATLKCLYSEERTWSEEALKGGGQGNKYPGLTPLFPSLPQIPTSQTQQTPEAMGSLLMPSMHLSWAAK